MAGKKTTTERVILPKLVLPELQTPTWEDINRSLSTRNTKPKLAIIEVGDLTLLGLDKREYDADLAEERKIREQNAKTAHNFLLARGNTSFASDEDYAKWYPYLTDEDKLQAEYKYNGAPTLRGYVSAEAEAAAQKRQELAAFRLALYEYALAAKNGLFSTKHGDDPAYTDDQRSAPFVDQLVSTRPRLLGYLDSLNMSTEDFYKLLLNTYLRHENYGTQVLELAHKNLKEKLRVKKLNDLAMTNWLTNSMRDATNNAALAGASFALNTLSLPAAAIATGVHNLRHPESRDSMGDFIDRSFGWNNMAPRQIFGRGENSEYDTGSGFINFLGNVATDPLTYATGAMTKAANLGNLKLLLSPEVARVGALGVASDVAPKMGLKFVTQTTNYVPKKTFKINTHGNYPRGLQILTVTAVPVDLPAIEKTVRVPLAVGGVPGVGFNPYLTGLPTLELYSPVYLEPFKEEAKFVKDWGDDCVLKAFREAAARGEKDGAIISACGKTYIYHKDPNFKGRVRLIDPNDSLAGGTNDLIVAHVADRVQAPLSVIDMRIPAGYRAVVTDDKIVQDTPIYLDGTRILFKQKGGFLNYQKFFK